MRGSGSSSGILPTSSLWIQYDMSPLLVSALQGILICCSDINFRVIGASGSWQMGIFTGQ